MLYVYLKYITKYLVVYKSIPNLLIIKFSITQLKSTQKMQDKNFNTAKKWFFDSI